MVAHRGSSSGMQQGGRQVTGTVQLAHDGALDVGDVGEREGESHG